MGTSYERNTGLIVVGDTGNSRVAVIGPFSEIWYAFVERINTARIAEYQTLMAEYMDYYRGGQSRDVGNRNPFTGEGFGPGGE